MRGANLSLFAPSDGDLHKIRCNVRDESGRTVYRGEITFQGTRDPEDD